MKCPKCGGEIPFYDLKPNCKHCGVNIMYFTQEANLIRDAKRTELEGAAARMVIARVKAEFIGSKLAIFRMIVSVLAVAALLLPFGSAHYTAPFLDKTFSIGIIGVIQGFNGGGDGLIMSLPAFLNSAVFSAATKAALVPTLVFVLTALIDVAIVVALILGFLNLTKGAKFMKNIALVGAAICVIGQIVTVITASGAAETKAASASFGFGALAAAAMFMVVFFANRIMLKKGIEPTYKENDVKRRELLLKVRAGDVDLDSLPLPVFESEEEHEERMKHLEEALRAEEEGKEL